MANTQEKRMTAAIAKAMDSVLKKKRFGRVGLVWNRKYDRMVHVLDLQRDRFSRPGTASVTINIGVWLPEIWQTCWPDRHVPAVIREEQCFPRFRISGLLSAFSAPWKDQWWQVTDAQQAEVIWTTLAGLVVGKVLPFLDLLISEQAVRAFVIANPILVRYPLDKLFLAIMAHRAGDTDVCLQLLNEVQYHKMGGWEERVDVVRSRLRRVSAV